ncbi:ACP S-malonyltransferase, partial [Thermodesulfobacteriota bacterium]
MVTWVFPGQGSQKQGMGGGLFDAFADFVSKADAILDYSVKTLCLKDPRQQLNQTQYTQPALYVVNALSYFKKLDETGKRPDYVAGHSLGEYNALLAAGGIDFETGLKLVKKRSELMSQANGGAMAAVLNLDEEKIRSILSENNLNGIDIANDNTPTQIVISGLERDIRQAVNIFNHAGGTCIALNVSGAFHSRYMRSAQNTFEAVLKGVEFSELTIPIISNVHARPYRQAEIAANLADQITHPVKWKESIWYLMEAGAMEFEEVGPGSVLTNLIRDIRKEAEPFISTNAAPDNRQAVMTQPAGEEKSFGIPPDALGSETFKKTYGLKYAYVTGAMVRGIASKELVVRMGKAGMMGYLGTGGLDLARIENDIQFIQEALANGQAYGMNILNNIHDSQQEEKLVDLYLKYGIR